MHQVPFQALGVRWQQSSYELGADIYLEAFSGVQPFFACSALGWLLIPCVWWGSLEGKTTRKKLQGTKMVNLGEVRKVSGT